MFKTAWHGTSAANLDSILSRGIEPGHKHGADDWAIEHHRDVGIYSQQGRRPSVFVSLTKEDAQDFAQLSAEETASKPLLLELVIPHDIFTKAFVLDEQGGALNLYRTELVIPPRWIADQHVLPKRESAFAKDDVILQMLSRVSSIHNEELSP